MGMMRSPRLRGTFPASAFLLCLALTSAGAALGDVLERISADGVIRAGTRANGGAFAFQTEDGGFEGFSVSLLEEIRRGAELALERDVELELFEVTPTDRLNRVASGDLDIVCGLTTPTWKREQTVDFSLPFFRDGMRIMVYRERANRIADVAGLEIGVVGNTTTAPVIRNRLPLVSIRTFDNMGEAMDAFAADEVDGVANVGTLLLSAAERARLSRSIVLLPRTDVLATEVLACVLPQDDSSWRDLVNVTLAGLLVGIEGHNSRYEELYDRWFGHEGMFFYPLDRKTRDYLANVSIWVQE